jgi:HK97 family phage portal protein
MRLWAVVTAPVRAVKALTQMLFARAPATASWLFRGIPPDFLDEVGDGTSSSTVMAPLLWIARTFPEAPPMLWSVDPDGHEQPARDHPMLRLLQRPNGHYTGPILWMATMTDYNIDGNAYWLLVRDQTGVVREMWWAPSWMVTPCGDDTELITHYEYRPSGAPLELRVDDVVHFRFGLDADNPRKGYSPLKSVLREIFTDDEAARFTASLLRNMGVPGLIVSPDGGTAGTDDVQATKEYFKEAFSGDRRGEPLVMRGPTSVAQFGFSPEQLLLRELRRIPEERVSAVLGVPAIVAGLGAGLDRSTFTNVDSAKQMAYEANLIPSQRILAEDIRFQLLSQWVGKDGVYAWRFAFDLTKVRVLQADQDKLMARMAAGVAGGLVKRSEGRRAVGLEPASDGSDDVYLIPINIAEVPADPSKPVRTFHGKTGGPPPGGDDTGQAPGKTPAAALLSATSSNGDGGDHGE